VRETGPETAGILVEPVQGEVGVRVPPVGFLKRLRDYCDSRGLLLVLDEVQTGIARMGRLFAHEELGFTPDIMAVGKGIGGGFPLGGCLATERAAKGMTAGTHGSTYGGNPLAMAAGNAVLDVILAPGFLENVRKLAGSMQQNLAMLQSEHPDVIAEVRGRGQDPAQIIRACPVPRGPWQPACARPTPVAVHDNGHVVGNARHEGIAFLDR
jgi:acetylornithine/N-succinyldiaminopimelate aminotransferase